VPALQKRYAAVSASPVPDQVAQISSIVVDAQSSVEKRGAVLLLPLLFYAAVYTLITVGLLSKAVKLDTRVYVDTPAALNDLTGNTSVLQATVSGEAVSVTISSATPSGPTATTSPASQSPLPWPCAGGSCRASNDPISGDPPYTCNIAGKSGHPYAIAYSDMYFCDLGATSFALGINSLASVLAPFATVAYSPYSTIATVPAPTSSTIAASPTPAPTACVGGNGPLSLAASVVEFYIEHYCSGVANTKSNGETLNVIRTWPGGCALKLNDNQAIITSVSLDATNEYCASGFNDQVGVFFNEAHCNTAMSVDVNGCEFLVLKLISSFSVLTGACR